MIPELHRRASVWYEAHELHAEAVQHALAIPDFGLAARLIEPIALPVAFQGQVSTVLGWLHALPEPLLHTHPYLCLYYSSFLTLTNHLEAAEELLQAVERHMEEAPAEQMPTISGGVHYVRALIARYSGDLTHTVSFARQALAILPEAAVILRVAAIPLVAYAYQINGDVTLATEREVIEVNALIRTSGNPFVIVGSMTLLARLYVLQGRLHLATAIYRQVMQAVPRPEVRPTIVDSLFYYFVSFTCFFEVI